MKCLKFVMFFYIALFIVCVIFGNMLSQIIAGVATILCLILHLLVCKLSLSGDVKKQPKG